MRKPEIIKKSEEQILELIEKDDNPYVNTQEFAKCIGMDYQSLLVLIENGSLPFAIGGRHGRNGQRVGKILKLPLYHWMYKDS